MFADRSTVRSTASSVRARRSTTNVRRSFCNPSSIFWPPCDRNCNVSTPSDTIASAIQKCSDPLALQDQGPEGLIFEPPFGGNPLLEQGELDFSPAEKCSLSKGWVLALDSSEGDGLWAVRPCPKQ